MRKFLKIVIDWVMHSSEDKDKLSLTISGLVPFLIFFGFNKEASDLITNNLVMLIYSIGELLSLATALYGLARKLIFTFKQ